MQLQPVAEKLVGRLAGQPLYVTDAVAAIEGSVRTRFDHAETIEAALDYFGLHAVEAALLRNALNGVPEDPPVVDHSVYVGALEAFTCAPPDDCWSSTLARGTTRDVIPLWGDHLKVFSRETPLPIWAIAEPSDAARAYRRLRSAYEQAPGLARYDQMASGPALAMRPGLWLLKAATVQACREGRTQLGLDAGFAMVEAYADEVAP